MSQPTITVVAGLIQRDGLLLICQRRRDGAFPLKWEFPGGKVEPGETPRSVVGGARRRLACYQRSCPVANPNSHLVHVRA